MFRRHPHDPKGYRRTQHKTGTLPIFKLIAGNSTKHRPTSISFPDFFSKRFFLPCKAAERFTRTICACNITAILHPATNNINKANLGFTSNVIKADSEHLQTKQDIFSHFLIKVSLSPEPRIIPVHNNELETYFCPNIFFFR